MENGLTYNRDIEYDFEKLNLEHKTVLNLVEEESQVLEIGCHTGYFSYWLKRKKCEVVGVDIFGPCLDIANQYLIKSIKGNIEDDLTYYEIEKSKYDVILFMHVLEHLVNPHELLKRFKNLLKQDGKIIICLPNISNWNSRVSIIKGNFNYTESGLMDKTHLRFFNYNTSIEMIEDTGYKVVSYHGTSKVHFQIIPNLTLIWRANNFFSNMMLKFLKSNRNLIDSVLVFEIVPLK
jgi:2-polyprenyl-3-methyl-5-hydroxy-6-metoxy-1,4-benzoquinol methylase